MVEWSSALCQNLVIVGSRGQGSALGLGLRYSLAAQICISTECTFLPVTNTLTWFNLALNVVCIFNQNNGFISVVLLHTYWMLNFYGTGKFCGDKVGMGIKCEAAGGIGIWNEPWNLSRHGMQQCLCNSWLLLSSVYNFGSGTWLVPDSDQWWGWQW